MSRTCRVCKKSLPPDREKGPPFCSDRCHLLDLGCWADGSYAIAGEQAGIPDLEDLAETGLSFDDPERNRKLH